MNTRDYSDEIGLVVLYILNEWFFPVSMGLKIYYKKFVCDAPPPQGLSEARRGKEVEHSRGSAAFWCSGVHQVYWYGCISYHLCNLLKFMRYP